MSEPPAKPSLMEWVQENSGSTIKTTETGHIDVMATIGGVRGIFESAIPAILFVLVYQFSRDLWFAVYSSLGLAVLTMVVRLLMKEPFIQAVGGIFGVVASAVLAGVSGQARDYFVPGFFTTGILIVVLVISTIIRYPLLGVVFGYLRQEGMHWRAVPARMRAYTLATLIFAASLSLRLIVQIPLYLAGNVTALGATRVVMGIFLYAAALWLAWWISRPKGELEVPEAHSPRSG